MPQILPTTSQAAQRIEFSIEGQRLFFRVYWSEIVGVWAFDIENEVGPLLSGVAMVLGVDLLKPYGLGIGALYMADLDNSSTDAGPDDLGTRVVLVHFAPSEIADGAFVDSEA